MQPLPSGCGWGVIPNIYYIYKKNKAVPRDSLCLNRSSNAYYFEMRRSLIRAFLPVRLRR